MIIHISGPSGSGKSVIGRKIQKHYGKSIVMKDLDELRDEFINKHYNIDKPYSFEESKYQKYIKSYINKHKSKPIVFVGLNDNNFGKTKSLYYDLSADYKFYINIDNSIIIQQKCERFITEFLPEILKEHRNDITEKNKIFVKNVIRNFREECGAKLTIRDNNKWARNYKQMKYQFMSREMIYKLVISLINKHFK